MRICRAMWSCSVGKGTARAASSAVGALPTAPRIVAYFQTTGPADLLRSYCPTAEAQESLSIELMARSAYDPGASQLQRIMLSSLDGPTQYSFTVPQVAKATQCDTALMALKSRCDATLRRFRLSRIRTT